MSDLFTRLQEEQKKQQTSVKQGIERPTGGEQKKERKPTRKATQETTRGSDKSRDKSRDRSSDKPRETSRELSRELPTRDEIQEFSFRLRDELKVKVQAEVPHQWQGELEEVARKLNVKKLELYRFVFGEFLGKVKRGRGEVQEQVDQPV